MTYTRRTTTLAAAMLVGLTGLGFALADGAEADSSSRTVIGHRGVGDGSVTENTRAAIKAGFRAGAQGVEVDIRLTKDGEPVVMHDATMDRTTNCSGAVSSLTYAKFRACRTNNGEVPMNAYEAAWRVQTDGGTTGTLWLHMKVGTPSATLVAKIGKAVDKYGMRSRTVILADESEHLSPFAKQRVTLAHIFNADDIGDRGEGWDAPYPYLVPYNVPVTPALVAAAQRRGQKVLPVEDHPLSIAEAKALGVDGMVANRVTEAVAALR